MLLPATMQPQHQSSGCVCSPVKEKLNAKRVLCLLLTFEQVMYVAAVAKMWYCHIQPRLFYSLLQVEDTF